MDPRLFPHSNMKPFRKFRRTMSNFDSNAHLFSLSQCSWRRSKKPGTWKHLNAAVRVFGGTDALPKSLMQVVMSKGTPYTQQSYKVSDSFPFKWINKKWKEGFYVTSMATSDTRWAVVMSRSAGFVDQCVELDFMYPSEGIHRRWDGGFRITCCAATPEQVFC